MTNELRNFMVDVNSEIYDIFESTDYDVPIIECRNYGYGELIEFMGIIIWCSENDERKFNDKKDEYEPLIPYIQKRINHLLKIIKKIKLNKG